MTPPISDIFSRLLETYGPRGWWPLRALRRLDPRSGGYHPGDFSPPVSATQRFEIGVGAILTQNTTWKQVEGCLDTLEETGLLVPEALLLAPLEVIESAIRPSGYFRMKARKLCEFSRFFQQWDPDPPPRTQLLSVWGIGEETADSILLYAYGQPVLVVDAYTRRLVERLSGEAAPGCAGLRKKLTEPFLRLETARRAQVFNEFHALVVQLAKTHCRSRPLCRGCPLETVCISAGR